MNNNQRTVQEKAIHMLTIMDGTGILANEYKRGLIYITDESKHICVPLSKENPEHREHISMIEWLRNRYEGLTTEVYHVVVGDYDIGGDEPQRHNAYLIVESATDFSPTIIESIPGFSIPAYVENRTWGYREFGSITVMNIGRSLIRVG